MTTMERCCRFPHNGCVPHQLSGDPSWLVRGSLRSVYIRVCGTHALFLQPQLHGTKWRGQTLFFLGCITGRSVRSFTSKCDLTRGLAPSASMSGVNQRFTQAGIGSSSPKRFSEGSSQPILGSCCFPSHESSGF